MTARRDIKTTKRNGRTLWKCSSCKTTHEFSLYVVAHWHDELTHTCKCGAKHVIHQGIVRRET